MNQGDKVGSSALGELARSKDKFESNTFFDGVSLISKLRNMVKKIEVNPTNRKNCAKVLQDHRCHPTTALKRHLNGTRISAVCNLVKSFLTLKGAINA